MEGFTTGGGLVILWDLRQIITGSLFIFSSSLFLIGLNWFSASKNPKIAIYETKKFVEENPEFVEMPTLIINVVEKTGDPTKLNKWRENRGRYIEVEKKLRNLLFAKKAIENGKFLNFLINEIAADKIKIEKVNSELNKL
jgi:hypothetical protein